MDTVQNIVVFPQERIGTISSYLHGQFIEHIGEQIQPGILSKDGKLRGDVISELKRLNLSTIRWPGGCFADTYHWQNGIGNTRRVHVNENWGYIQEKNVFGTHEFIEMCRVLGAEPYIAVNVGSGTVREFHDWVEYANYAGSSELANLRRENGANLPFRVRYWGVGNESWGCGGNMTPEEYAAEFMKFRSFGYRYSDNEIEAIAGGANNRDWQWTKRFFDAIVSGTYENRRRINKVNGYSIHYYAGRAGESAVNFDSRQWLELLSRAYALDGIIQGHRSIVDQYDNERKIKLIVDEWGTWHKEERGKGYRSLYQQNTMRDAVVAAISLDVLHNHADKVYMANIAQMINVLQSLLLVNEQSVIKTPTYHVFDLYQVHKGAMAIKFLSESQVISDGEASRDWCSSCSMYKKFELRVIHGSASLKNNSLCITAVNAHPFQAIELHITVYHVKVKSVEIAYISAFDMHDYNTFEESEKVKILPIQRKEINSDTIKIPFPAASIVRLICNI